MRSLTLLLFLSITAFGQGDSKISQEDWFNQGLKAYQGKNWEEAKENFQKALGSNSNKAAIYYNLGLAYFQMNKKGYAVGYWRKALASAPGLAGAETALGRVEEKYHFSHIEKTPWAQGLHAAVGRFGWNVWLPLFAILFGTFGFRWLAYFKTRKSALGSESVEVPPVPIMLWALSFLFLVGALGLTAKILDEEKLRATVTAQSAEVKSAPTADGVTLYNVPEAAEVQILRDHEGWVQVNTGEGSGGWLKKTDVLSASKDLEW